MNQTIDIMKAFAARAVEESRGVRAVWVEVHSLGLRLRALEAEAFSDFMVGWNEVEHAAPDMWLVDWAFACLDQQLPAGHPYKAAQPRKESEHG
jgi:hypothetical protein